MNDKTRIIALEEHYIDGELSTMLGFRPQGPLKSQLEDLGSIRVAAMDAAGIDVQILSLAPPGLQGVTSSDAPSLARRVNDRLHAVTKANPSRFAAFAGLPTADPIAAADELERTVLELGFKGAMINGPTGSVFLDDQKFWPIFERAERLKVPVYIHPSELMPAVKEAYFSGFTETHPMFMRAAWGYTIETGTQAMRLVQSGVFDKFPDLRIILGHMGEAIPFLLSRIDEALSRDTPMKNFREVFCRHFYVTTSGFFSDPALLCCGQELGIDRILFSVDWPFASNDAAVNWFDRVSLSREDKAKIRSGNISRLVGI